LSARIKARLRQIEKRLDPGICTVCKGRGGLAFVWEGREDEPLPCCRRCGLEAQTVVRLVVAPCRPRDGPGGEGG